MAKHIHVYFHDSKPAVKRVAVHDCSPGCGCGGVRAAKDAKLTFTITNAPLNNPNKNAQSWRVFNAATKELLAAGVAASWDEAKKKVDEKMRELGQQ